MNLSDDLTPAADPAPLLRAVRCHRRLRIAKRAFVSAACILLAALAFWPRPKPPAAIIFAPEVKPKPVAMTREELLDSLKDETFAFIQWPDGREQLLIRH